MIIIDFVFFGIAFQGIFLSALLYYKLKDWTVSLYYLAFSLVLITWVFFWLGEKGAISPGIGYNFPDFSLLFGPLLLYSISKQKHKTIFYLSLFSFFGYVFLGFIIADFFINTAIYSSIASIILNSTFLIYASKRMNTRGSRLMSYALTAFVAYMIVFLLLSYLGFLTLIVDYITALLISCFFYISGHQYLIKSKFRSTRQKQNNEHKIIIDKAVFHLKESQIFLNADYRILDLARDLEISNNQLTEAIRCSNYENFKSLINHYRVDYSKKLLKDSNLKVLAVALESGFNNKVSFNTNFKKFTGTSPATYRKIVKG